VPNSGLGPREGAIASRTGWQTHVPRGPAGDADEGGWYLKGNKQFTPCAGTGTTLPRPFAGARSTLPSNKKRGGSERSSCTPPSPLSTRRGGPPDIGGAGGRTSFAVIHDVGVTSAGDGTGATLAVFILGRGRSSAGSPSPPPDGVAPFPPTPVSTAAGPGATSPAGTRRARALANGGTGSSTTPATAAHVAEIMRSTPCGFAGARREITKQRKELAILNSQLCPWTKKVDDMAVLADCFTASLIFQ